MNGMGSVALPSLQRQGKKETGKKWSTLLVTFYARPAKAGKVF